MDFNCTLSMETKKKKKEGKKIKIKQHAFNDKEMYIFLFDIVAITVISTVLLGSRLTLLSLSEPRYH